MAITGAGQDQAVHYLEVGLPASRGLRLLACNS